MKVIDYRHVTAVRHAGGHTLWLRFSDGVEGLPGKALQLVDEWRERHRDEMLANWERMERGEAPEPIAPLEQARLHARPPRWNTHSAWRAPS